MIELTAQSLAILARQALDQKTDRVIVVHHGLDYFISSILVSGEDVVVYCQTQERVNPLIAARLFSTIPTDYLVKVAF